MVSSSSPYDWLSIDHYCWYSFAQYYDSICQWKLDCCQTFPTKLTAQHLERSSFMTQSNKASSKYSSILPICGKVPADLFLTLAITNKGFPVLSVKKFCEAIFNAFTVFSYILWKSHTQTAAALSGRSVSAGAFTDSRIGDDTVLNVRNQTWMQHVLFMYTNICSSSYFDGQGGPFHYAMKKG